MRLIFGPVKAVASGAPIRFETLVLVREAFEIETRAPDYFTSGLI
jgi:hypothetical protein